MIIKSKFAKIFGFDAITIWPIILITPETIDNIPLIAHEIVHYDEQQEMGVVKWLFKYWLNKTFRFEAEVRGHAVQVKLGDVSLDWAANHIATKYKTGFSKEQALQALTKQINSLWQHQT